MQYSKGDTIKLEDGRIILVLNNGTKGNKFIRQYFEQKIMYLDSDGFFFKLVVEMNFQWEFDEIDGYLMKGNETVWYNVLIGDIKMWTEERNLSKIKYRENKRYAL